MSTPCSTSGQIAGDTLPGQWLAVRNKGARQDGVYTIDPYIWREAGMLDMERQYFEDHRAEWLEKFPGKVVLVKGDRLVGTFDTLDDALSAGARLYGLDSYLVRHVEEAEAEILIPALTLGLLGANS